MSARFIVVAFGVIVAGCETGTQPNPACFVCSEQPPHARLCSSQIGRLEFEGDSHTCNLYFGATQLCESVEYCCHKQGLVANAVDLCVDPETVSEESEAPPET